MNNIIVKFDLNGATKKDFGHDKIFKKNYIIHSFFFFLKKNLLKNLIT